ncbi:MAG TPA: DUF420 domain-containing protein [Cytophagaceae bacterium]
MQTIESNTKSNPVIFYLIAGLSIAVPVIVGILFYVPQTGKLGDFDVSMLPHFNALLNTGTSIALLFGFYYIKYARNQKYHRNAMVTAFVLSTIFLISYVIYHFQGGHVKFGDIDGNGIVSELEKAEAGSVRYFYYFVVLTHIVLAAIVVPFVLLSIYFAASRQLARHKKIVKYTFPIWLYVAVSGVVVYLMISPYYQ